MTEDLTRPRFHFTAREGWINDPLGLTHHDGRYHLFFQYVSGQTVWGPRCAWGHATSPDLLAWTEGAAALEPGEGDDGVWSGSVVVPDGGSQVPEGGPVLFYTSVTTDNIWVGRVRTARPRDERWTAWEKGPVVAALPPDVDVVAYRDPYVFADGGRWWMLLGAGLTDGTATALVYVSDDLESWTYSGPLAERHTSETAPWTGSVWECPQLFPLGDRWVLTVSVWEPEIPHYEAYAVGRFADGRFVAESWARLSYGPSHYAASTFVGADGARGLISWLRGVEDPEGRWAGAHSLPHVLELSGDRVVAAPHPALDHRRGTAQTLEGPCDATVSAWADVTWEPRRSGEDRLTLTSGALEVAALALAGDVLTVRVDSQEWVLPWGSGRARLVLDGPVLEVFTDVGVFAAPVPVAEPRLRLRIEGAGVVEASDLS